MLCVNMFLYFYYILQVLIYTHCNRIGESTLKGNANDLLGQNEGHDDTNNDASSSLDSGNLDAIKYKRILSQDNNYQPYETTYPKNSLDNQNADQTVRDNFPYGIVYNNGKPLGILEPLPREYRNIKRNLENLQINDQQPQEEVSEDIYPVDKNKLQGIQKLITDDNNENSEEFKRSDGTPTNLEQKKDMNQENLKEEHVSNIDNKFQQKRETLKSKIPKVKLEQDIIENKDTLVKRNSEVDDFSFLETAEKNENPDCDHEVKVSSKKHRSGCCKNGKCKDKEKDEKDRNKDDKNVNEETEKAKKRLISVDDDHIERLREVLNKLKNPSSTDNIEVIGRNLRSLLIEMGLAENDENLENINIDTDSQFKRSIYNEEDENLESSSDNIEISKVNSDNNERKKRHDLHEIDYNKENRHKREKSSSTSKRSKRKETDKKDQNKRDAISENVKSEKNIRSKREGEKANANEIMKNVEGELTITGNKTPLASSDSLNSTPLQQNTSPSAFYGDKDDQLSYQERIERNIQSKIDAIKEEVRREIETLKNREKPSITDESSRKKRDITHLNLINEESPEIDPNLNIENNLKPLIRKRRNTNRKENLKNKREVKNSKELLNNKKQESLTTAINAEINKNRQIKKRNSEKIINNSNKQKRNSEVEMQSSLSPYEHKTKTEINLDQKSVIENKDEEDNKITEPKFKRKKRETYDNIRDYIPEDYIYRRKKRSDMSYTPYKDGDDDYEMNEGDEFDEDGYFDRNRQRKRQTDYESYNFDADDADFINNNNNPSVNDGNNYRYRRLLPRRRRQNEDQYLDDGISIKRGRDYKNQVDKERQQISGLSESDIFGGLPQSYTGELARYKRVKRQKGF